jgi:hypothetical protein
MLLELIRMWLIRDRTTDVMIRTEVRDPLEGMEETLVGKTRDVGFDRTVSRDVEGHREFYFYEN